jgi:prophage maintenance system killer protein
MESQIDLAESLLFAEAVYGIPAERLLWLVPLEDLEEALAAPFATVAGGVHLHHDPIERAVLCCSRIARDFMFPGDNRGIGFVYMREMLDRDGFRWIHEDPAEIAGMIERLARHEVFHDEFVSWVRARTELVG